jgi:hypothetical protein
MKSRGRMTLAKPQITGIGSGDTDDRRGRGAVAIYIRIMSLGAVVS